MFKSRAEHSSSVQHTSSTPMCSMCEGNFYYRTNTMHNEHSIHLVIRTHARLVIFYAAKSESYLFAINSLQHYEAIPVKSVETIDVHFEFQGIGKQPLKYPHPPEWRVEK